MPEAPPVIRATFDMVFEFVTVITSCYALKLEVGLKCLPACIGSFRPLNVRQQIVQR